MAVTANPRNIFKRASALAATSLVIVHNHPSGNVEPSNADLFGEPAWDMIVDLFIAAEENKTVSVSSLCIDASVPMTTVLRWNNILAY